MVYITVVPVSAQPSYDNATLYTISSNSAFAIKDFLRAYVEEMIQRGTEAFEVLKVVNSTTGAVVTFSLSYAESRGDGNGAGTATFTAAVQTAGAWAYSWGIGIAVAGVIANPIAIALGVAAGGVLGGILGKEAVPGLISLVSAANSILSNCCGIDLMGGPGGHMLSSEVPAKQTASPIVLDLDGGGITTTAVSRFGTYFDLDADGFAGTVDMRRNSAGRTRWRPNRLGSPSQERRRPTRAELLLRGITWEGIGDRDRDARSKDEWRAEHARANEKGGQLFS